MLKQIDTLPSGFLETEPTALKRLLGQPTLIHLEGRDPRPLFVSVLMHGNETTGFLAMQHVLRRYARTGLPRALSLFVANVDAAEHGMRRLDGQPDYNRIWPRGGPGGTLEHDMMASVVDIMRFRDLFASVDVHNNTGLNPHYACVNVLDERFFHLATLFSRTVVYFVEPSGVQSMSFAELCPAVTLECGQPGQRHGLDHAVEYIDACLHLNEIPEHPVAEHDIDLFHTVASVRIPDSLDFCVGSGDAPLRLAQDLDHLNFRELPAGTSFGSVSPDGGLPVVVTDEHGDDVSNRYFEVASDALRLRTAVMPSMLTKDPKIIRQDCLCYLMERFPRARINDAAH